MWPNPQLPEDLVTLTEEIFNGKLHFLCSVSIYLLCWWKSVFRTWCNGMGLKFSIKMWLSSKLGGEYFTAYISLFRKNWQCFTNSPLQELRTSVKNNIGVIPKWFEICEIRVVSLWVVEDVSAMARALLIYLSINLSTIFT